jgi:Sulfatase
VSARAAARYAPAGALLAVAPLAAFLAGNGYPFLSPEAAIGAAACLAVGALVALCAALGLTLGALVLGAGTALALDFLYGAHFSKAAFVGVPFACIGLALLLRRHAALVVGAAAAAFLLATLAIAPTAAGDAPHRAHAARAPAGVQLPPVLLHLILDEHIGLDGLPRELAETAALERELRESYAGDGFRLYAGAYSEYSQTRNSIANLLNFTSHEDPWSHLVRGEAKPYVLARSAYFQRLAELGYTLHLYQSDYIDLCRVQDLPYARCASYRANSIGSLRASPLDTGERVRFIFNSLLETSSYLARMRLAYARLRQAAPGLALPQWQPGVSRVGPLAVLPVMDALERDLRSAAPGQAYVAHLLIPHFPYVLDESCRPRERIEDWRYNFSAPLTAEVDVNSADSRAERYRHYYGQIRCQQALLGRLFAALKAAGAWDSALVVVHGDHGSRIFRNLPTARNAARLTREDLNDGYSTLFALRKPGVEPGIAPGMRPLQELLAEAFGVPMKPLARKVYLRNDGGRPLARVALQDLR